MPQLPNVNLVSILDVLISHSNNLRNCSNYLYIMVAGWLAVIQLLYIKHVFCETTSCDHNIDGL